MNTKKTAFTLAELIVSIVIVIILSTIWFVNYSNYIFDAKDGKRETDLSMLGAQLELYKKRKWAFPIPQENFTHTNNGKNIVIQGKLTKNTALDTTDNIPYDPELDIPYLYSTTNNRQEYQLAGTLFAWDQARAIVQGNYTTVSINTLPSLFLATQSAQDISSGSPAFIIHNNVHNIPYEEDSSIPYSDGETLSNILFEVQESILQNFDYTSCEDIFRAAKHITDSSNTDEYQIRDSNGAIISVNCQCDSTTCTQV